MDEQCRAERFEEQRARLRAIAYRMLGSAEEAEDAVQETWLRLSRVGPGEVQNLGGFLTTVVSRVCLDVLRSRQVRGEASAEVPPPEEPLLAIDPEEQALQADAIGAALLVVLDTLSPGERLAFVLHDLFGVSFDDIAPILGRTAVAARQLAHRARRRVQGAPTPEDQARQKEVVEAFLLASRNGEFDRLLALLDPEVVLRADAVAVESAAKVAAKGAPSLPLAPEVRGAEAVARIFSGRAKGAQVAWIDGEAGAAWAPGGRPRAVFAFTVRDGKVVDIDLRADPASLAEMAVTVEAGRPSWPQ